jgi:hypothetical protein
MAECIRSEQRLIIIIVALIFGPLFVGGASRRWDLVTHRDMAEPVAEGVAASRPHGPLGL